MKKFVAFILLALLGLIAFSCAALSGYIMPTPVDETSIKFAAEAGSLTPIAIGAILRQLIR